MTTVQTIGTQEWIGKDGQTKNISKGCFRGCHFCYARLLAAQRKQIPWDQWTTPEIRWKEVKKGYRKCIEKVMFPSTHDIYLSNYSPTCMFLDNLLPHVNSLLIVTKPDPEIIRKLCSRYERFYDKIEFRFTITTVEDSIRKAFEPNAPSIDNRFKALEIAINHDFKTSVSVEPFLDVDPGILLELLWAYGAPPIDVWIGPMNHRDRLYHYSAELREAKEYLEMIYSPNWLKIVHGYIKQELDNNIHFKDGFLNQMRRKSCK